MKSKILLKRGIIVFPDILANAGGLVSSYFEWKQNLNNQRWSREKFEKNLKKTLLLSYKEVFNLNRKTGKDLKSAAYLLALRRLKEKT